MASREDLSDALRHCLTPIAEYHFPINTWTPNEINSNFITVESFIANAKIITEITNEEVLDQVLALAIHKGFWVQNKRCTPAAFFKFSNFLKTREGSHLLAGYWKKAVLKEQELDREIAEMETQYMPASIYKKLDEQELTRRAYQLYLQENAEHGEDVAANAIDDVLLCSIRAKYGEVVRHAHMLQFLNEGNNEAHLDNWFLKLQS